MNTKQSNKEIMQSVFAEMAAGNHQPFLDILADDIEWTWMGTYRWSRSFKGKDVVVNKLFGSTSAMLAEPSKVFVQNFIAEGNDVVVEFRGENKLLDGRSYNNIYCWVCSFSGGKLQTLREYMDTELVTAVFGTESD